MVDSGRTMVLVSRVEVNSEIRVGAPLLLLVSEGRNFVVSLVGL